MLHRNIEAGFVRGELVWDPTRHLVGKLIEIRRTPIFKEQLAILERCDGSVIQSVLLTLKRATSEQSQEFYSNVGFHRLGDHRDERHELTP